MAPPQQAPSPFGWTGIRFERYSRWKGHMDGRPQIIRRMITEGVWFNVKTIGVIVLIVLSYLFSLVFPVLSAAMGGLQLEANTPNTYSGNEGTTVTMGQSLTNGSIAVYPLVGANLSARTSFSTVDVPLGWGAYINKSLINGHVEAELIVIPPSEPKPFESASVSVIAKTGGRTDEFATWTVMIPDEGVPRDKYSFEFEFDNFTHRTTAGNTFEMQFTVDNTGTVNDTFNVTLFTVPKGWKVHATVDGATVTIKSRSEPINGLPKEYWPKYKYFQVDVLAGKTATCTLRLDTKTDSAKANLFSVGVNMNANPGISGMYHSVVYLTDTKKTDMTDMILYGQVLGTMALWTLLLAAVVGSKMIATDLNEKSYNLYFARPLTKRDYLIGKFGTVSVILGLVTVVPALITYAMMQLLCDISNTYVVDHLSTWGSLLGYTIVLTLTFSTLSLAFSSVTNRRFYAGAALVVIYLVTSIVSQIVTFAFESDYGRLIGIGDNLDVVSRVAFGMGDTLNLKFPWWYALVVLAVLWVVSALIVWYKVERTELSE